MDIFFINRYFMHIAYVCKSTDATHNKLWRRSGCVQKIRKEVYDTAKIAVYYDLKYLKDSTKTDKYTEAKTLLQISDKYTKYGDYYQLALDSMDIYMGKSKKNARDRQAIKTWNEAIGRINYYTVSITDLADYQTKVQFYDNLYNFEYSFTPQIDWNIVSGDTIISDIPCKKATCSYAGRDYVAWYADNISLPYGPYIFNGLPGLIIDIRDAKGNWIFTSPAWRRHILTATCIFMKRVLGQAEDCKPRRSSNFVPQRYRELWQPFNRSF